MALRRARARIDKPGKGKRRSMNQDSLETFMDIEWTGSRDDPESPGFDSDILNSLDELHGTGGFGDDDDDDGLQESIGDLGIDFDIFPEIAQDKAMNNNGLVAQGGRRGGDGASAATNNTNDDDNNNKGAGDAPGSGGSSELVGSHDGVGDDDGSRPQSPNQSNSFSGVAESMRQGGSSAVQPSTPPLDSKDRQPDKDQINVHVQNVLTTGLAHWSGRVVLCCVVW